MLVIAAAFVASGCGPDHTTTTTSGSAEYEPTIEEPTTTAQAPPATESTTSTPRSAEYPLTQAEAIRLVEGGLPVAGLKPDGLEVLILESTETEYEEQPVEKEVCGYEYDYSTGENEYDCHWETVYEERPVEKRVYVVTGAGIGRTTYENVYGAFAEAGQLGAVSSWRQG